MRRDPKPSGRRRSARSGLVDADVVVDGGSVVSDDELTDVADSVVVVDTSESDGPDEQAATTPITTTSPRERRTATSCRVVRCRSSLVRCDRTATHLERGPVPPAIGTRCFHATDDSARAQPQLVAHRVEPGTGGEVRVHL
jgi:hypothetical protein